MVPPSYMRSVVDRNVVMRRMTTTDVSGKVTPRLHEQTSWASKQLGDRSVSETSVTVSYSRRHSAGYLNSADIIKDSNLTN